MAQLSLDQWITLRLSEDPDSPWHALVHCGCARKTALSAVVSSKFPCSEIGCTHRSGIGLGVPDVCESSCRMVISLPRVRPGMKRDTRSSSESLPLSASMRMAVATNCLVFDPILYRISVRAGTLGSSRASP